MATKFKREPKEKTTEPSVDEVGHGMKKGGHAHKKHMMMGGAPMGATPMVRPRTRMAMAAAAPTRAPMMRKHGGEVESKAEHKAEMHEMHKMEKELKHHEHMPASKAHRGLKKGGIYKPTPGGLLEEGKPHHKAMTGAVEGPGYKHGGHTKKHHKAAGGVMSAVHEGGKQLKHGGHAKHHMAKGGTLHPHIDVQDKVVEAKQRKSISSKTGALEGVGYKHGGHTKKHHYAKGGTVSQNVAKRYENTMVHDGVHSPMQKKAGTGEIKQVPAGYKKGGHVKHHAHGGHVAHHTTHGHGDHGHTHMHQHMAKHDHGHDEMDGHPMKHGGKAHHTSKVSTHHKKGGKCNY